MNQVIRYQYQYIVWSIYMIVVYLSLIAQVWLILLSYFSLERTWPVLFVWFVMIVMGGIYAPKGEK